MTIYIHKGDSTIFANVKRFLTFYIDTPLSLKGWTARFILGGIIKDIEDISTKSFEVVLSADETNQLRYGTLHGAVILMDSEGNTKTIVNTIPFEITSKVVENESQTIDLTIPESAEIDIKLQVGSSGGGDAMVYSVNGMLGDVVLTAEDVGALPDTTVIPDTANLVTKQELSDELKYKQPIGDYALASDIPTVISQLQNDSQYQTLSQVMALIATIPQFSVTIADELPLSGEKMTLYLIPKDETGNDVYSEYIWVEQTSSFEFLGTTAVDLTDYVTKTEFNTTIGNINAILDTINGEVI